MSSPIWLTTLDSVRLQRKMVATETDDDAYLSTLIIQASRLFMTQTGRTPVPIIDERKFDYQSNSKLDLDEELVSLVSLTNGDGASIATADVYLQPTNREVKDRIITKVETGIFWTFVTSKHEAITVNGVWGFVPDYSTNAFLDSGVDIPVGDLTAIATTVTLSAVTAFEVGHYIRVNAEIMRISAIDTSSKILTLVRAELGTTGAAHAENDDIEIFQQLSDIAGGVRDLVVFWYLNRNRVGQRVQVFDGIGVVVENEPASWTELVIQYSSKGKRPKAALLWSSV